jgi:ABC-type amino acid transport substrate-binding protein
MLRFIIYFIFFTLNAYATTTYTIGVEAIDYSPIFSSTIGPRNYEGYTRDVLDRFAKSEGIEFRYIPLPIKRFVNVYQLGQLDFAFPDNPQWEKEKKFKAQVIYSRPVIDFQDAIFVLPERLGMGVRNLKVLGTLLGFSVWKFNDMIKAGNMTLESASTPESLINMALLGRVDAINLAKQVVYYYLKKMNRANGLVIDPELLPIKDSHYYLSTIKHPRVIKRFNLFLKKDEVYLSKLRKKYGL